MQKKIAVINDISGFGRCSIAVSLPIISYLGVQCCPVPTSIFSNHTGYPHFFFDDYTDRMPAYIANWKKLGLTFEGITTGFLGSVRQIRIVKEFIREFSRENTLIIIDPVMGDNGRLYSTYTKELCEEMKQLTAYADILTPNLTECCNLTDTPYKDSGWKKKELYAITMKAADLFGESHSGILHQMYMALEQKLGIVLDAYKSVYRSETGRLDAGMVEVIAANDRLYEAAMDMNEYVIGKKQIYQ